MSSIPSRCPDAADIVSRHNAYRALHQAQPLVWDNALAAQAQAWAARNAAAGCALDHDWSANAGENIFLTTEFPKPDSRCGGAVEAWYAEVDSFKFNTDKLLTANMGSDAFHFTQLVS
ncbi:hypothetical protein PLESTF_000263600 [Pleodorina starrii]|nr:hypothetical protein PLESTF_000263600 [Pleodorina starrii]